MTTHETIKAIKFCDFSTTKKVEMISIDDDEPQLCVSCDSSNSIVLFSRAETEAITAFLRDFAREERAAEARRIKREGEIVGEARAKIAVAK